jgi:MFS family permease
MVDNGLTKETAAYFFGILGIAGSVGKVFLGYLSDIYGRERVNTFGAGLAMTGILCLIYVDISPELFPLLFALLFGLGYGAAAPLLPSLVADIFLGKSFGVIFAMVSFGGGIGGATGSYVAGLLFDLTQTYTIPFAVFILSLATSAILIWLAAPRQVRRMVKAIDSQNSLPVS